ncbi:hypothetical protein BG74_07510 [Sodalis-like endosymbiont of Proechinophthirus fluctus]|nr:hypothetical protein BG74_07510 [Sodalis-like endosymbiont of Proechinophthirus fluctus]
MVSAEIAAAFAVVTMQHEACLAKILRVFNAVVALAAYLIILNVSPIIGLITRFGTTDFHDTTGQVYDG